MSLSVLIIGYNRPHLTKQVLAAVEAYGPERIYLACDGPPKNDQQAQASNHAVRELMRNYDFRCPVFTRFENENTGVRLGPIRAIDWFFDNEPEGIVLEDDCLPSAEFFSFCEHICQRYRNNSRVWGASGFNPNEIASKRGSYGFIRFHMGSGWVSWADRWKNYDRDLSRYEGALRNQDFHWPSEGLRYGLNWHLKQAIKSAPAYWDYQLSWSVVASDGLWAVSNSNLVVNLGFGPGATTTKKEKFPNQAHTQLGSIADPLHLEPDIGFEEVFLRRHLRVYKPHWLNHLRDLVRTIKACQIRSFGPKSATWNVVHQRNRRYKTKNR